MKKPSANIQNLINRLSKSEKRYFKLISQRHIIHGENNYVGLFDLYLTHKEEEKIKSLFESKYRVNHFPVVKKQLYDQVLDGLSGFYLKNSTWEMIKSDAHKCQILLNKGLPQQAQQLLTKTKDRAMAYEYFELLPELFDVEKKILSKLFYRNMDEKKLLAIQQTEELIMQQLINLTAYKNISSKLYQFHFHKIAGNQQEKETRLAATIQNKLIKNEGAYLSKRAELEYLQIKALICFIEGKAQEAYVYNERLVNLVENNKMLYELYAERYLSTLNNFLIDNLMVGKYDVVEEGIEKLQTLAKRTEYKHLENIDAKVFRLSFTLKLNMYLTLGKFEKSTSLNEELKTSLAKFGSSIAQGNLITFYYLIAYLSFGNGDLKTALNWINVIINERDENVVEEIVAYARLLNIVIHYDLGNYDLLDYQLKNTRTYLKNKNKLSEFAAVFLKNIEKLLSKQDEKSSHAQWKKLKNELSALIKNKQQLRELNYFNYLAWINSKMNHVSFKKSYLLRQ